MPLRWINKTKYIDIETGEWLTEHIAKEEYVIIRTKKTFTFNETHTIGTVDRQHECKRRPAKQGNLFGRH